MLRKNDCTVKPMKSNMYSGSFCILGVRSRGKGSQCQEAPLTVLSNPCAEQIGK